MVRFNLTSLALIGAPGLAGCLRATTNTTEPEKEAIARTEFTKRSENCFEYERLKAGQARFGFN